MVTYGGPYIVILMGRFLGLFISIPMGSYIGPLYCVLMGRKYLAILVEIYGHLKKTINITSHPPFRPWVGGCVCG